MKIILLSIDALMESDLEYFRKLPAMGRLLEKASVVPQIMSIYPTYTYACHASMASGCYPDRTKVAHNVTWPEEEWMWDRRYNKAEILTDVLKRNGYSTASVCFPMTGGADIDINVPEVWAERPDDDTDPVFRKHSSEKGYRIYQKNKAELNWMKTPAMDEFATDCVCDILDEHQPDFIMAHLSYLDHQRHNCGPESECVEHAIRFIDTCVEKILDHADGYKWIIVGDHGHRRVFRQFSINKALEEMGETDKLAIHSVSFSAEIYPKEGVSEEEVTAILKEMQKRYPMAIEAIWDGKALLQKRVDGDFSHMIDSYEGVTFYQGMDRPLWFHDETSNGNHGYPPEKGPFSPLVFGEGFVHTDAWKCHITDIAPTILSLFGLESNMDGHVIPYV